MDEWAELGSLAVSLMLAAAFIVSAYTYMNYGKQMVKVRNEEYITAERLQEYRAVHSFDNKNLLAQDVVSVILECRNKYPIQLTAKGNTYSFNGSTPAANYSSEFLFNLLNVQKEYYASIQRDAGGSINLVTIQEIS